MPHRVGDKVRVKGKVEGSPRGTIIRLQGNKLVVQTEGNDEQLVLPQAGVTNFSLAARKAWASSPDRAVGRKRKTVPSDRLSVTLRIDRELWRVFRKMEESGEIEDRTATINGWFREKLEELSGGGQ